MCVCDFLRKPRCSRETFRLLILALDQLLILAVEQLLILAMDQLLILVMDQLLILVMDQLLILAMDQLLILAMDQPAHTTDCTLQGHTDVGCCSRHDCTLTWTAVADMTSH